MREQALAEHFHGWNMIPTWGAGEDACPHRPDAGAATFQEVSLRAGQLVKFVLEPLVRLRVEPTCGRVPRVPNALGQVKVVPGQRDAVREDRRRTSRRRVMACGCFQECSSSQVHLTVASLLILARARYRPWAVHRSQANARRPAALRWPSLGLRRRWASAPRASRPMVPGSGTTNTSTGPAASR